jgi:hypothetical protein
MGGLLGERGSTAKERMNELALSSYTRRRIEPSGQRQWERDHSEFRDDAARFEKVEDKHGIIDELMNESERVAQKLQSEDRTQGMSIVPFLEAGLSGYVTSNPSNNSALEASQLNYKIGPCLGIRSCFSPQSLFSLRLARPLRELRTI